MDRIVDSQNLIQMNQQAQELEDTARAAGSNSAARFEELFARIKTQLLKGGKSGRQAFFAWWKAGRPATAEFCPALQLANKAAKLQKMLQAASNMTPAKLAGAALWDGCFKQEFTEEYYSKLLQWRPASTLPAFTQPGNGSEGPPVVLLLEEGRELLQLKEELEKAGAVCHRVFCEHQANLPGLGVADAVARFWNIPVGIVFTDAVCAPFADEFPRAVTWQIPVGDPPAWDCPEYRCLAAQVLAKAAFTGEESPQAAQEFLQAIQLEAAAKRDLLVLSTINFDFLRQRPQHLATLAAEKGHRVLYINPDALGEQPEEIAAQGRLRVVRLPSHLDGRVVLPTVYQLTLPEQQEFIQAALERILKSYGIVDPIVKVEHPLWGQTALFLQKKAGASLVFDYLDEYAGFSHEDKRLVQPAMESLLQHAEAVVATAEYLYHKAELATGRRYLIRNGVESRLFEQAYCEHTGNSKPVVGYYGVVSDWFAYDMILALENSGLDIEIRLIGVASPTAKQKLSGCKKVTMGDSLPYARLPEALAQFDVCLIPFDVSNPLIQATNPVKFYEYLAAGKKVVATSIPELLPYKEQFVLLQDDPEAFVRAVESCLNNTDGLLPAAKRQSFARENDWNRRADAYEEVFSGLTEQE